jgi:4'-phosphopantetheinyl transferase
VIGPGECGVWWAPSGSADPALVALLGDDERARVERMRNPAARDRMVVAWALARALLGEILGEAPAAVAVERHCARCGAGDHGKPQMADSATGLHFSLTHSGDHAGVALTRAGAVGVDVECPKPGRDYRSLYRRSLTAGETAALQAAGDQALDFLRVWVRKEAVTKAVGTGVATRFDSFEVAAPGLPAAVQTSRIPTPNAEDTTLVDLATREGCPAAVAVLAPGVVVAEHDGSPVLRAVV